MQTNLTRRALVVGLCLGLGALAAKEKSMDALVGTWRLEIPGGPMGGGVVEWTFDAKGAFQVRGYPELKKDGEVRVKRASETELVLEIVRATGDLAHLKEVRVEFVADGVRLNGQGPFKKVAAP